jgi:transcriptional regulator with XRE-family HTH domain
MAIDQSGFRAEAIAELLRERGMTEAGLAMALGVSKQRLNAWTRRAVSPQLRLVIRLASLTGKPLDYFVEGLGADGANRIQAAPGVQRPRLLVRDVG